MRDPFLAQSEEAYKQMEREGFKRVYNPTSPEYGTYVPGMGPAFSPTSDAAYSDDDEPRTDADAVDSSSKEPLKKASKKKPKPPDEATAEQLEVWIKHTASTQRSTGKGAWTLQEDQALIDGKKRGASDEEIGKEVGREVGLYKFCRS